MLAVQLGWLPIQLAPIPRVPGLPKFTEYLNIACRIVTYESKDNKRKREPLTLRLKAPEETHPFKAGGSLGSWTGLNLKLSRVVLALGKLFNLSDFSFLLYKTEDHPYLAAYRFVVGKRQCT